MEEDENRKISQRRRTKARFNATTVTNMAIMLMSVRSQRRRRVKTVMKKQT
jgi:hypothetical protein